MKSLFIVMTLMAVVLSAACPDDSETKNCSTELAATVAAVAANNTAAVADEAKATNQTIMDAAAECKKTKGENVTTDNTTTPPTVVLKETCASYDCEYALVTPVESKEFMDLYQCEYGNCDCGTLAGLAKTMSFGLLLAFGAYLIK